MCAHTVRVALERVDGVDAVELSLNQGRARIRLAPDNTVTLAGIHDLVRRFGFTPKEATVNLRARTSANGDMMFLIVADTDERLEAARSRLAAPVWEAL